MVPRIYYTKDILQIIDDALDDGVTDYNDILEAEKEKLAVYCMNALKHDAHVFITNSEKMDKMICQLKTLLLRGGTEEAIDLATTMCEAAVEKLDQIMPDLFYERLNDRRTEQFREAGLRPYVCDQTGETRWSR